MAASASLASPAAAGAVSPAAPTMPSEVTVAIIGGGVSGICVASRLAATMPDATMLLLEREAEIGGTWHAAANYPGAACDVPSHFYSYSFAQNPSWSRRFAPAAEIKAYLQGVAARFGVMPHVRVSTKLEGAVWDEAASRWVLTAVHLPTGTRTVLRAHFLVSCVGALYVPNTPDIKGKESFPAGAAFHSARWNWSVPLEGKRIAVIGTGASAAQFVPQIAAQAGTDITVFQRNAPWIVPRRDYAYPSWVRGLFWLLPPLLWAYRILLFLLLDLNFFAIIKPTPVLRPVAKWLARRHLEKLVPDPAVRAKLTPTYEMGCKRVLLSDDYLPTFNRPNVHLVTDGIAEITPEGVRSKDGALHKADVLIWGTGFDVIGSVAGLKVTGAGGVDFNTKMVKEGAETYKGIMAAGFPNLFICLGPNTGLGHTSIIFMIECQTEYLLQCIRRVRGAHDGVTALMPRADVQSKWSTRLQGQLAGTIWNTCSSWYNATPGGGPGGRNITMWPHTVTQYWLTTRKVDFDDLVLIGQRERGRSKKTA